MSQQNIDFITQNVYANFQTGNIEGLMAVVADDVAWNHHGPRNQVPFSGSYSGKAGAGEQLSIFVGGTETEKFDVQGMYADADKVFVLIQEGCKVKCTGKSYETLVAHIWTVNDGQIIQFDELYDSCAVAAAYRA
jgi:ketosteroid isomerase-like protein